MKRAGDVLMRGKCAGHEEAIVKKLLVLVLLVIVILGALTGYAVGAPNPKPTTLEQRVAALEAAVSTLRTDATTLKEQVASLQERLNVANQTIASLQETDNSQDASLATLMPNMTTVLSLATDTANQLEAFKEKADPFMANLQGLADAGAWTSGDGLVMAPDGLRMTFHQGSPFQLTNIGPSGINFFGGTSMPITWYGADNQYITELNWNRVLSLFPH